MLIALNDDTKILTETNTETLFPETAFSKTETLKKLAKVSKPKCQSLLRRWSLSLLVGFTDPYNHTYSESLWWKLFKNHKKTQIKRQRQWQSHPGYPVPVIQSVLQGRVYHRFGIFLLLFILFITLCWRKKINLVMVQKCISLVFNQDIVFVF